MECPLPNSWLEWEVVTACMHPQKPLGGDLREDSLLQSRKERRKGGESGQPSAVAVAMLSSTFEAAATATLLLPREQHTLPGVTVT